MLLLSLFAADCFAFPKPFWLKEGAYAYYYFDFSNYPLTFSNGTLIWKGNGTYGWKCVGITGNTAILEILCTITGKQQNPNETNTTLYDFAANYTISINVETREAFSGNESLGFLPYWIPADVNNLPYMPEDELPEWIPKLQWRVIENFTSYGDVTTYGLVGGVGTTIETPYKTFAGDKLWSILGAFNSTHGFVCIYEKDSGLWIAKGTDNFWPKIMKLSNNIDPVLRDTNIFSLPEPASPLNILLPYITTTTALLTATASIYFIKIRKKP
jgi:hypothetical protein